MLPTIVHCKHFPHQRFDWLQSFDLRAFTTCNTRRKYLIAMQWKSKFEGACGSASLPASHWPLPVTDGRSKSNGLHSFCNSIKLVPKDTIYIHTVLIVKVYIVSETKSNHKQFLALHPPPVTLRNQIDFGRCQIWWKGSPKFLLMVLAVVA